MTPRSVFPRLDERGIALALVLFAMVLSSALILGVFFAARMDERMGDNTVEAAQALAAAEAGATAALANWNVNNNSMAVGASSTSSSTTLGGAASYTTTITRLNPNLFLVTADGRTSLGGATRTRRQVGQLAKLLIPTINMNAAITTRTGLTVSGSSQVSGDDSLPPAMSGVCPTTTTMVPGIRDSSGNVTTSGACSGASCITGSPQIQTDPTITSNSFTNFGSTTFSTLAASATLVVSGTFSSLAPVATGGVCNTAINSNWGDPLNSAGACFNYFPIIYSPGNLRLTGGYGQGLLLVQGDLELSGGVEFYGPVIVQGRVYSSGTGGHIIGGVMAGDANFSTTTIIGNSVVNYSSCAITRALRAAGVGRAMGERSWAQLY
jgi:Tfp pilus assembly protein PilX